MDLPSAIEVLQDGFEVGLLHLQLAQRHHLTARRIHDARHAATALHNNVTRVYTYDPTDWNDFLCVEGWLITPLAVATAHGIWPTRKP